MVLTRALVVAFLSVIAAEHCDVIDGVRQSPIDIDRSSVISDFATSLKWSTGYYEIVGGATLVNDGHSLRLNVNSSLPIQLSEGELDVPYEFQQLHFHWGDADEKGSEHTINNNTYPLEMHAVHSQSSSSAIDEIVVVGYFFTISPRPNRGLQNIIDAAIAAAENRDIPITVKPFSLSELLASPSSYYAYKGSLTTPPFSENVSWIVSSNVLPISRSQLDILRIAAQIDTGLNDNFRCVQELNDRIVRLIESVN